MPLFLFNIYLCSKDPSLPACSPKHSNHYSLYATFSFILQSCPLSGVAQLTHHPAGEFATMKVGEEAPSGPFDLSLLELKAEDELDLRIFTPVCLARTSDRDSFEGQLATVVGWGTLQLTGEEPDPLEPRHVELEVRPAAFCPGLDQEGTEVSPSDLCAGLDGGGKGSCRVS